MPSQHCPPLAAQQAGGLESLQLGLPLPSGEQRQDEQSLQYSPESCSTAERTSAVHDDAHPPDAKIATSSAQVVGGWSHELMQEWGGFPSSPSSPSSPATVPSQHCPPLAVQQAGGFEPLQLGLPLPSGEQRQDEQSAGPLVSGGGMHVHCSGPAS